MDAGSVFWLNFTHNVQYNKVSETALFKKVTPCYAIIFKTFLLVGKYPYFRNDSKVAGIFEFYFVNYD